MTTYTPHRSLVRIVFAVSLVVCGANQIAAADDESIFVAFTDLASAPVTDITASDLQILWDGVACELLELEPLTWPVRVSVYIDNSGVSVAAMPHMREGVKGFLDALPPDIDVAIGSIAGRPQLRSPYTTDRAELIDALGEIAPEGGAATFWDALYEEAERLHKDEDRQYTPVIVMVAVGGPEGSRNARSGPFKRGLDRLYANGATVHTLLLTTGVGKQTGRSQSMWGADIAASTYGRFEPFVSPNAFRTLLPELAKDLARKNELVSHQYRATYKPPKDASDQPRIQLKTRRAGLNALVSDNGNIP